MLAALALLVTAPASLGVQATPPPFDYFQNSWQVIGLRDYNDGTRITPQNELLLAAHARVRLTCGPQAAPLSRQQTKTLLEGWLPIILLDTEEQDVKYEWTLWAAPLPAVTNWRAAFDEPIAGEDFMNWILVRATGRSPRATAATVGVSLVATNVVVPVKWEARLQPGQPVEAAFCFPFHALKPGLAPRPPCRATVGEARRWLDRTAAYWHRTLDRGARISVPCAKATLALRAAHVCQLIASDHGVLHGGEGFYDEFYIRDGGYQMLELEEAGLFGPARRAIDAYLRAQRPDGRFETQANQLDANGQALWTLWQYGKITGDRAWLRQVYPQMRRAVEWIKQARRLAPPDSPFAGLLPAAPADGEFLWDGKHHILGYDFWNLRGLHCVADAARALGESGDARDIQREADDLRRAIDRAWERLGLTHFPPSWEKEGTHWGNTETLWPTELFAPDDPRVAALQAEVRERHGGGFIEGTIRWTGQPDAIHPYLSSYTTMTSLLRGEHDRFVEEFYWYLLHSSASQGFPEGVYFKRRYAWSETLPHVTGAANFAFMLRHALIHERGDELHLLLGAPDEWLAPGQEIRVENAPTHFGPMSLRVRGTLAGVKVAVNPPRREPCRRIVVHLPDTRRLVEQPAVSNLEVMTRPPQARHWDFETVVRLYQQTAPAAAARPTAEAGR